MGAESKSGKAGVAAHRRAAKGRGMPQRGAAPNPDAWEQTAQVPDARDDELDCQRIVQGDGSRTLPLYYDDYN